MANDRISQLPVEAAVQPDNAKARTSQDPVEAIVAPDNAKARSSQEPVEAIVAPDNAKARESQVVVEVLVETVNVQTVSLGLITQTAACFAPTVAITRQYYSPALINQTAVAFAPTVSTTGAQAISLGLLSVPATAFSPSVSFPGQISLPYLIDRLGDVTPERLAAGSIGAQAITPTVASSQSVTLARINRTATPFAPTVFLASPQTVTLGLLDQTAVAYAPFVWHTFVDGGGITVPEDSNGDGIPDNIIELFYDGVDMIDDVVISDATFSSVVNGVAGECHVRVKDTPNTRSFVAGKELLLRVNGENVWRGYVATIKRVYAFEAEDRSTLKARFFVLDGWDINVLFLKRIVYNKARLPDLSGPTYKTPNTSDVTVFRDLVSGFLDLSSDGLNTTKLIENVGTVNLSEPTAPIQPAYPWAVSMRRITEYTNAIYYIDPDKCVVLTDVDTPNAPYDLSDVPNGSTSLGYREMQIVRDGTNLVNDALIWGVALGSSGDVVFGREEDSTSIAAHGRWQFGERNGSIYKQATVNKRADTIVQGSPLSKRGAKNDKLSIIATVFHDGFRVAQKVDISSEVFGFNDVIPIRRMDISFATKTALRYRLTISHEIDQPLNYFDNYFFQYALPDIHNGVSGPPPPPNPPAICDPDDFIVGSEGGQLFCTIVPEVLGGDRCYSYDVDTGIGDLIFLYGGATYEAHYLANRAGGNGMGVGVVNVGGAPVVSFVNMGKITDGNAFGPAAEDEFTVPVGFTGYYKLWLQGDNYVGYDDAGMQASVSVSYVSGPDPRFVDRECTDGDTGFHGIGDSTDNQFGDSVSTVYTLTGAYVPGTTVVFLNGFFQRPGHEYTESNPAAGEITFAVAPPGSAAIVVYYQADGERTT